LLDMPPYSCYQPFMNDWGEVMSGAVGPVMDAVWNGDKNPTDVLPDLAASVNEKFFQKK